jgi:HlyD family secretion protein
VLDLQVIAGQTVAVGQRLGTIGRLAAGGVPLKAVSYFAPADARRLRNGMPVEVVPQWNQRSRFGGIVGKVLQMNTLPATEEDISTTIGNPQLAKALVESGPVMRAQIDLERDPASRYSFRWILSRGSDVFPVREGLTLETHPYLEWRTPLSYVLPGLRSITGGHRTPAINRTWKRGLEPGEADRQQSWGQETPGDNQRRLAGFRGIRRARASWAGPEPAPRLPPGRAEW